ncbi:MAG: nucleoside triphosphate pyrophosphohydrolase [Planctomycetes bacterium]|nr:nucleoside triphosphate pyrophosphohydrolase [Planctomycetota bacterium]
MSELERLKGIIDVLRSPGGCPWDREQTAESLKPFLLEEAHEVADAIDSGSAESLEEELGDLLMNIFLQARIAEEESRFTLEDVAAAIADKLVRRHPHVFADAAAATSADVRRNWEEIKAKEKGAAEAASSALRKLPASLPALMQADRIGRMAAEIGFDWPNRAGPLAKIEEELSELRAALAENAGGGAGAIEHEIGDLIFAACSLARHEGIDPEAALKKSLARFRARFAHVEARLRGQGAATLETMERYWRESKHLPE